MDTAAYEQYQQESADWLRRGRAELVRDLIAKYRPDRPSLELLEVGAGVGQNLPTLASFGVVDATEINPIGQSAIRAEGVARELFTDPIPFELGRTYDVICALDVIEHIEDDREALRSLAAHLRPGGIFVATVPAYQALFSDHDRALHHFRRYTKGSFAMQLPHELSPLTMAYFNHLLFPVAIAARGAWSLKQKLSNSPAKKQASPRSSLLTGIFGRVLGAELALIERGYRPPWGLSVYCVARRI